VPLKKRSRQPSLLPSLSRGAACVARSLAFADSTDRARHGWSAFGNSRHFERTWIAAATQLETVNKDMAFAAPRVWRAMWISAVLHRLCLVPFALSTLVLVWTAGTFVSPWCAFGVLVSAIARRVFSLPYFVLDRPTVPISSLFKRRLVRRAIRSNIDLMRTSALHSAHLSPAISDPLATLHPAVRVTAQALAPGFAGTIGELKEVAAIVTVAHLTA
jgi:hypothetical protein